MFASDEEVLAAAEEAYGAYRSTVDTILQAGGIAPERLQPLVSEELYERELPGFEAFVEKQWRIDGVATFELVLQSFDNQSIVAYVCDDMSGTTLLDGAGLPVVSGQRQTLFESVATFDVAHDLQLVSIEAWDGGGVCPG